MKRLPITIGTEILLRPLKNQGIQVRSLILGARHGDFMIIETPTLQYSDRLSAKVVGDVICRYIHDGELYAFNSSIRKSTAEGFTLLDYPSDFEVHVLRKHTRIRVNIETMVAPEDNPLDTIKATITDISEGGCMLVFDGFQALHQNLVCMLDFILPDKSQVRGLKGKMVKINFSRLEKATKVGLQFLDSSEELEKISAFCRFCSFFEV